MSVEDGLVRAMKALRGLGWVGLHRCLNFFLNELSGVYPYISPFF